MEKWKPIKGYEGLYEISDLGRVKSLPKLSGNCCRKEIILKNNTTKDGYHYVTLAKNNKQRSVRVHRLVAASFIPNPDSKETVNHKDGIKLNNHVHNLEWATRSENVQHSYDVGLKKPMRGATHPRSKLLDCEVKFIRENYMKYGRDGLSSISLASIFGVTHRVILMVAKNTSYKNVK